MSTTSFELLHGDCLNELKNLPDNCVDSVVTDPPYGISFMGKKWDYDVPSVEIWKEVLRVLKPGGHLLSFGGTRTYHRLVVNIEDAGFEIRDQIQWLYGSGFPKSHNLKDEWQGWGTALKPANEPICLARKPLKKSLTVAQNVIKWGCGVMNIDASRVGSEQRPLMVRTNTVVKATAMSGKSTGATNSGEVTYQGRWPANIILDEVAAEMLDEQSGNNVSRFFYVAKASKRERGEVNSHPTVKPVKLMEYLIKLITPPGGVVLDPFMGSGSTGVAALKNDFIFLGIEREAEYIEICNKRLKKSSMQNNEDNTSRYSK